MSLLAAILVASTSLHITVWPNGADKPAKHEYTLRCASVGGTLPHRATACRSLLRLRTPFAPTPRGSACAQIYGGPQTALVTGRLRGKLVRAGFSRKDGCAIASWNRVRFLFPVSLSS